MVALYQENRNLIARLEAIHGKLKVTKSRLTQAEAELHRRAVVRNICA